MVKGISFITRVLTNHYLGSSSYDKLTVEDSDLGQLGVERVPTIINGVGGGVPNN